MKFIKLTIYALTFLISFSFVNHAYGATEFVSVVDTGNGTETDYTSLSAWETGVQTDLTAATTLVFAGTKIGTMADNASVTGASSLATATIVHVTSTQILLENISGTFQNGEQIQIDGSNYFTTSNVGDSAIAVAKCRASTGAADTTAVVIDGWTTSATNYIKVWTDPTEGYRHEGKWDDRKYRIDIAVGTAIDISEDFIKIDGLQVKVTSSSAYSIFGFRASNLPGGSHTWISNNIVVGVLGGTTYGEGITMNYYDNPSDPARVWDIWNNVVYGFNTSGSNGILGNSGDSIFLVRIYNNTVYDCDGGIGGGEDYILKNNISYNNNTDYFWNPNTSSTNNLSSDNSAPAYGTYYRNATVTFADETNDDFHLKQSDTGAKNVGANLSAEADADFPITTDVDGSTRTGTWDIGADEAAIQVFYSVGQNTNDHKTSGSYVQDNFNRSDANPIGGNWSAITSEDPFRIVSNQIVATVVNSNGVYWNANTFDDDQYSQATIKTVSGTYIGVMTRISSSAKTYYFFGSGATSSYVLGKYVSGSWTLINTYTETQTANDVIKLRAVGTTLTPTLNGTDLQSFTDSSISSGSPGIHTYGSASTALDDWEGGNLGGSLIAPLMSISSGVGTFSVAQTATNMGVGDKVTYDTSTVAYISEKISTTEWKLITATGGTPANITDSAVVSIAHPFSSLSLAEAGAGGASYMNTYNLVTGNYQLNIPCYYDTGADTTAVVIDGWATSFTNYIKVYTPNNTINEVNQSQRHSGKWDDGKYRLQVGNSNGITAVESNVVIDGLQLQFTTGAITTDRDLIRLQAGNVEDTSCVHKVSNNIIQGIYHSTSYWMYGVRFWDWDGHNPCYIFANNNIIYGFSGANSTSLVLANATPYDGETGYFYNNTIYGTGHTGIYRYSGELIAKNNISYNNTNDYGGTFNSASTNNLSKDASAPGINAKINKTVVFADETNKDFHLVLEDAGARSYGANLFADAYLPVKDDIDGQTRGEPWDIGADQYQGTVENSERNLPASLESGLIGYWSFDSPDTTWTSDTTGTTDDLSGNNYDGTLTNMLKASSPIGGISGQGFDFRGQDATADNVSVTHGTAFDSVNITYSAWIKPDTISGWDAITEVTPTQDYFGLYNGQYSIWGRCGNIYLGHTIARNQWAFVAYVISGENYYLYEDGELIASGSGCSTSTTGHGLLKIGARSDDSMGFDGVIDEVRVYSRALSIDEVVQLYKLNAGKMQPNSVLSKPAELASGLVGHWSFDGPDTAWTSSTAGTTNDLSGNGHTGTLTNMSRSASPVFGKLGQALKFDGVDDYVSVSDNNNSLDGVNQVTLSLWYYPRSIKSNWNIIAGKGNDSINYGIWTNNNQFAAVFYNDGWKNHYASNTYSINQWYHLTIIIDNDNNTTRIYVNGVDDTAIPAETADMIVDNNPFYVAPDYGSYGRPDAIIDEVRVYNRVLSSDEVADLYQTGQMKILK